MYAERCSVVSTVCHRLKERAWDEGVYGMGRGAVPCQSSKKLAWDEGVHGMGRGAVPCQSGKKHGWDECVHGMGVANLTRPRNLDELTI